MFTEFNTEESEDCKDIILFKYLGKGSIFIIGYYALFIKNRFEKIVCYFQKYFLIILQNSTDTLLIGYNVTLKHIDYKKTVYPNGLRKFVQEDYLFKYQVVGVLDNFSRDHFSKFQYRCKIYSHLVPCLDVSICWKQKKIHDVVEQKENAK